MLPAGAGLPGWVLPGGRVLGMTALGDGILEAKRRAYAAVDTIHFENAFCRRDIADKAVSVRT
jgi:phosphoribosylamine--glycine ligase